VAALLLACRGVDLNAADQYGVSPLICAAKLGDDHMMGLLLAASRSASAGSGCPHAAGSSRGGGAPLDINAADQHGSTALIWAARMGSRPCLQLLLGHPGVDANACSDTGLTALHAAAVKDAGLIDNVQLLLQHGASLDAADQHGQTVLCLAVKRSNNQLVQLLWRWQQAQLLQLQAEVAQWRAMPAALAESIALFAGQVPRQQR
jgi:ankyrin repeat protein